MMYESAVACPRSHNDHLVVSRKEAVCILSVVIRMLLKPSSTLPLFRYGLCHFDTSADRQTSTADTPGLRFSGAEVLMGFRNCLNMDRPEHHSTDRLKEKGVEKRSGRHSTLRGRERSVFNQTKIGTVSRPALGRLLIDEATRVWTFPSDTIPS